jgi:hypothetical protein
VHGTDKTLLNCRNLNIGFITALTLHRRSDTADDNDGVNVLGNQLVSQICKLGNLLYAELCVQTGKLTGSMSVLNLDIVGLTLANLE